MIAKRRSGWRSSEAGFLVLIELLVAVVIIAMLASYFLMGPGGGSSKGGGGTSGLTPNVGGAATSIPGKARDEAESVVCRNNLQQIRTAIATYQAMNGGYPPDLPSLQTGVPLNCPVGGEPYEYDPNTGQVHCVHPHHEAY